MDKVFDSYAAYYDLLYKDKNYACEAAYVHELIQRYDPNAQEILELGCGTGGHAMQLTRHGYRVTGIDRSEAMLQCAWERAAQSTSKPPPKFVLGDLKEYRAGRDFDVVLALFHVMSYQASNKNLLAAVTTAAAHLRPGGLFIFDCWYGPGVLTDPPKTRVRRMRGDDVNIVRIAEPVQYPNENKVDVHYEILVEGCNGLERIREVHTMRYLFAPEVDLLLQIAGLKRLNLEAWLDGGEPDLKSWNVCFVCSR